MILKKFPHEFQMDAKDCGPACLKIIAKYYGKYYSLQYLRDKCGITRPEPLPTLVVHRIDRVKDVPPLSFGYNFTQEQMTSIVACANTYHLFCVSMLHIEDMEALFSCKEGFVSG